MQEGLIPIEWSWAEMTAEDFEREEVYAYLHSLGGNPFKQRTEINRAQKQAQVVKYTGFRGMWSDYQKSRRALAAKPVGNVASWHGQDLELDSGPWICTEDEIYQPGDYGQITACTHPILPIARLVNVDDAMEHIKIAYRPGRVWRTIKVKRSILASPQSIIKLSDYGVAVTSESAKALIRYMADMDALNYETIPRIGSTSRVGWVDVGSERMFLPYDGKIEFDGEEQFGQLHDSIHEKGDPDEWIRYVSQLRRNESLELRILIAASFASVLVDEVGALPFFVHLWGGTGTGKTVAQMVAASVWGDPETDAYLQSYNSTSTNLEVLAGYLNSLPLIIDESQHMIGKAESLSRTIYQLASGGSRGRSNTALGTRRKLRWRFAVISSGEYPLTDGGNGQGEVSRVVSINCSRLKTKRLLDGPEASKFVRRNYGYAGKMFVDAYREKYADTAQDIYTTIYNELMKTRADKHAMAGAVILAADHIATDAIFRDDMYLTLEELMPYLATKGEVDVNAKGYDALLDWIQINNQNFEPDAIIRYGEKMDGALFIYRSQFDDFCRQRGYDPTSLADWLSSNGKTRCNRGRNDLLKRTDYGRIRGIALEEVTNDFLGDS